MTYNQKIHCQLLKRSQDLKNQGKDLLTENSKEYFELSKLSDQERQDRIANV